MQSVRPMDFQLLDFQGRVLREGSITRSGDKIEVYTLPNGLYFLLLHDSATEQTAVEKVIIRK